MIGFNTSLEGLSRSETQFNQAAQQIALSSTPQGQDTVNLSDAAVQLLQAKNNFDANTKAIKAEGKMDQYLLNADRITDGAATLSARSNFGRS